MKHLALLLLLLFHFSLFLFPSSAAVPLKWTVETSAANPTTFDQFAGATYDLEATLQSRGKPLAVDGEAQLFWQTNGMGSAWWSAPASITNLSIGQSVNQTILKATWLPSYDVGAKVYNCFIGITGTVYNAAFQLRLRPSPGAVPNALPLPTPVIDFSKVTVLNPPWSGGGSGGVDTNSVLDIIHKTVEGSARYTPKYLWVYDCDDTYPEDAAWYYAQPQPYGSCSAVREGGFLYRNYDWRFDDAAEFVVRTVAASATGAGNRRFASIGVANCGTNLTEQFVTSGKPSRYYKCLPGRVVDGINENGVVCEVNVVGGDPHESGWPTAGSIHCLGAVRHVLDHATTARSAASDLADHLFFPAGFSQNFHWMVADERETWIVENGTASNVTAVAAKRVMTNFPILNDDYEGEGMERYQLLRGGASITNAWWTLAYLPETSQIRYSDLGTNYESIWERWAEKPREAHRGESSGGQTWWQTVHTSVYDITNRTLRIAVQETDDWYTFAVPGAGGVKPEAVKEIVEPMIAAHHDDTKLDKTGGTITREDGEPVSLIVRPDTADMEVKFGEFSFTDNGAGDGSKFSVGDFKLEAVVGDDGWYGAMKMSVDGDGAAISVNGTNVTDKLSEIEAGVSAKRDLTDNTCRKSEGFGLWTFDNGTVANPQPYLYVGEDETYWLWQKPDDDEWAADGDASSIELTFIDDDHTHMVRTAVCVSNELFVTSNGVNSAFTTNNPAFVSAVHDVSDSQYRSFGDEFVYEADGFTDFTWHGNRIDAISAIGSLQPTATGESGGYTTWVMAFEMDGHYYWGDAHAITVSPEVPFAFSSDWYDESIGEWVYDYLELTARRQATGYHRSNPIDTFARQSRLDEVGNSVDSLRNRIDGETKVLRTGKDGERGSGWGYLQTSLDGDYRNWRFRVPKWTDITGATTNNTGASQTYVSWTNGNSRSVGYSVILNNPLSWSPAWACDRTVRETRGAQGLDAVQQADYDVGILRKSSTVSGGSTYYLGYTVEQDSSMLVKVSMDMAGWIQTNRVYRLGSGGSEAWITVPGWYRPIRENVSRSWIFALGDGYEDIATYEAEATGMFVKSEDLSGHYVSKPEFRFYTVCENEHVKIVRSRDGSDPETLLDETIHDSLHYGVISVGSISSATFEDAFAPYYKLVGTLDYGIFYDEDKDCSWQIKVRNGCFFQEKYCDGDWRK